MRADPPRRPRSPVRPPAGHHAAAVHGQQAVHAAAKHAVPRGRRGRGAVQLAHRRLPRAVQAAAHGARAGRVSGGAPLRVPVRGRGGRVRRGAVQGHCGHRRQDAARQPDHPRPARAAHPRAGARARLHRRAPRGGRAQRRRRPPGHQAAALFGRRRPLRAAARVRARLQARPAALLHPRRRPRRHRRHRGQPEARALLHGAVARHAAQLRQHVVVVHLVRAQVRRRWVRVARRWGRGGRCARCAGGRQRAPLPRPRLAPAGEEEGFVLPPEESAGHTVKRGQRVIQLAFGAGFKTNSSVLLRL